MPVFHFHVVSRKKKVSDLEGTELFSIEEARIEAVKDARSLMSDAILNGKDISSRSIEITTPEGDVLLVVPFAAAYAPDD
jgi:hypothetical protein